MTEIEKEYYRRLALQEEYGGTNKPVNKITPLVSVVTTTYQHAPYIRQCLDSVLMQETDFPFELIIGEDGSTDGTREICIEYANKYPDKIRLFLRDRKLTQYVMKDGRVVRFNGHFCRAAARGEYVAICEGDDYWIDKRKLSRQVSILESNKHIVLCSTSFKICDQGGVIRKRKCKPPEKVRLKDILASNSIATCTCLYRNIIQIEDIPRELMNLWYFDYVLWTLLLEKGYGIQIPRFTSVYRINRTGLAQSTEVQRKIMDIEKRYAFLLERYPSNFRKYCQKGKNSSYINISWSLKTNDLAMAKRILSKCSSPLASISSFIKYIIMQLIFRFQKAD